MYPLCVRQGPSCAVESPAGYQLSNAYRAHFVSGILDVCFVDCDYEFSQHQRGSRLGRGVSAKRVMHATLKTLCLQSLDMNELFVTDIMECNALLELEF
jgi:hypothetical protein